MRRLIRIVLLLLLASILTSCVTRRQCENKFPCNDSVSNFYITETKFRDTLIFINVPADTVYLTQVITVKEGHNGLLQSEVSYLDAEYAWSKAWVKDGNLKHTLVQKDTAISKLIENVSTTALTIKERVVYKSKEKNLSWWQSTQIQLGRLLIITLIVLIIYRAVRKYFIPP